MVCWVRREMSTNNSTRERERERERERKRRRGRKRERRTTVRGGGGRPYNKTSRPQDELSSHHDKNHPLLKDPLHLHSQFPETKEKKRSGTTVGKERARGGGGNPEKKEK